MSRTIRLGEQIREEVGDILGREVRDPGIGFITLTRVRVTDDLSQARIYYTMLGEPADRKKTARALERALPSSSISRSPTRRGSRNCSRRSSARTSSARRP